MKLFKNSLTALMLSTLTFVFTGCNGDTAAPPAPESHSDEHSDEHAHPSEGPHHGDLVELGDEAYHAEMVHTDNDELVIYILGSDAKSAVPIDAAEVVINVVHDGNPEQFKLTASADTGDPEGKSSRFMSTDEELLEHVHEEAAQAKLVLMIDGQQFTGKIAHDHDADHGHSHD